MSRWLPLLGVIAFLGFGIGLRCAVHRYRYGTWGIVLFRARHSGQWLRDSLALVLIIVTLVQAMVMALQPQLLESSYVFRLPVWIGAVVMFAGVVAMYLAQGHLGSSWRIGIDEGARLELMTGGLYRFCRNPIFLTMLVCVAGFTLMVPTRISLVMLAGAAIAIRRQVVMEERYLTRNHGDAYRRYARDVGRFLPWLGRLR